MWIYLDTRRPFFFFCFFSAMPRSKKTRTPNALECPICFKICKSESSLTRHCNSLHQHTPGYSLFSENTQDVSIIPPDPIVAILGIPPDILSHEKISDNNEIPEFSWDLSGESSDDFQYNSEDIDNSSVTSDGTTESFEINGKESPNHADLVKQHESLSHHNAGYTYEIQGTGSRVFEIQKNLHVQHGHPFSPWSNEDEFWLAYLMVVKAKISMSACNDLLDGFRNGRISMRSGLSFHTNRKMLELIDQAKFITVLVSLCLYLSYCILLSLIMLIYYSPSLVRLLH